MLRSLSRISGHWFSWICLITALAPAAIALADEKPAPTAEGPPPLVRPAYGAVRYNEDWSVLKGRDLSATGDIFDPFKYVPLTDDGWAWASFGGQWRTRFELWSSFNFGGVPAGDDENDTLLLNRFLYHADLHFGPNVRVFVEGKSAFAYDHELPPARETLDIDELALQNGFVDLRLPLDDASITFRGGRQELLFGKQRLVSPLDWANTRRTFDGFSAIIKAGEWSVTPFFTHPVMVDKYGYNEPDGSTKFYGVYGAGKMPGYAPMALDLYWLALEKPTATFNGTSGEEDRHTLGGRIFGAIGRTGFDYDLEGAYQFGEVGSADISAWMIGSEVGYAIDMAGKPRVFVGFDYGSGDDSPGGDVETFNQLFPLGHAYLGWIDAIGRQNIIDVAPGISFTPIAKTLVTMQTHFFWRADDSDALYNAGGGVVRAGSLSDEREVGVEFDLLVKHQFDPHLAGFFGYSHFFAGDFIKESGATADDDIDFIYAILQYTF